MLRSIVRGVNDRNFSVCVLPDWMRLKNAEAGCIGVWQSAQQLGVAELWEFVLQSPYRPTRPVHTRLLQLRMNRPLSFHDVACNVATIVFYLEE